MTTIYQIGPGGLWTGATRDIGEADGVKDGWTRAVPPTLATGESAIWTGGGWSVLTAADTLAALKALKLAALAAKRWEVETGPFALGEMTLVLDEKTTNKLDAAYMFATRNPAFTAEWKLGNGAFVTLDAATIIAIGDAVGLFVQACFAREKALTLEILAANDFAELVAIDLDSGWPT